MQSEILEICDVKEEGENLKAVQKRVGHADITTTLGVYAQTNLNEDRKLVNTYEEEFYNKLGLSIAELYLGARFSHPLP